MTATQSILVWGANSAISREVQKLYVSSKARFFLVARDPAKLAAVANDLSVRGGEVCGTASLDFNLHKEIDSVLSTAGKALGTINIIIIAHGSLPDQTTCENSVEAVKSAIDDNFTSTAVIAQCCATLLASQGNGSLAVISSVAGDRGRKSNYVYGAAKSGIDAFLQGLHSRFAATDVNIINIKPGMVITPMTENMSHSALWATPESIAPAIVKAIAKRREVCYVPGYWRIIMWVIRALPGPLLAKLPI